jgi:hypothetical protein
VLGDQGRLRTLAGSRRAHEQDPHQRRKPS